MAFASGLKRGYTKGEAVRKKYIYKTDTSVREEGKTDSTHPQDDETPMVRPIFRYLPESTPPL